MDWLGFYLVLFWIGCALEITEVFGIFRKILRIPKDFPKISQRFPKGFGNIFYRISEEFPNFF
jgi:hypothetical protein